MKQFKKHNWESHIPERPSGSQEAFRNLDALCREVGKPPHALHLPLCNNCGWNVEKLKHAAQHRFP